ncbi:hypothetical protein [Lysobacter niastensis]|uniref:Uncharacterized protein n=1 Tax=Lysobacter niastensis TaxID=380629 RepID=A0ABS0B3J8_9GAMM|nr:hypothetical protein [Lysobacter niastensis]MBF6022862.1 hypothetical protein [Lysobacter niastensis]
MADAQLVQAQEQYLRDKAASPTGFLRHVPTFRDGYDMATGKVFETLLKAEFGEWEDAKGLEGDDDLTVLRSLHTMAHERFGDMVNTFSQVAADDDPSLNADGRLKIAVRIIEPKLAKLAELAEREFARVDEAIKHDEAEIAKAVRVADPIDIAVHSDIRAHIRSLSGSKAAMAAHIAINSGDLQTLQAIASAPAYMTGLVVDGEPHSAYLAVQRALQERMAPNHTRRVDALRLGKARALQALSALDRKANKFLDFKRARQLIEREVKRGAAT